MVVAVLLAAVVLFVVVPSGRMTRASSAERPRSGLLEQVPDLVVTDCGHPFEGSAVVRFPAGRFDRDQLVRVTAGDRQGWIRMMKQAIARIGPVFNTQRMMETYAREAYHLRQDGRERLTATPGPA